MKTVSCFAVAVVLVLSCVISPVLGQGESEVRVGDSLETVLSELGKPRGRVSKGSVDILLYARGSVELDDGRVVRVRLVSPEQARAGEMARVQRESARNEARARAREQQLAEGSAIKAEKEADPQFAELPVAERLKYWEAFQRKYRGIPVDGTIARLREEMRAAGMAAKEKRLQEIDADIAKTTEEIQRLAGASGWSRTGLVRARKELTRLRRHLADLNEERESLAAP